jgi:hypothetical protein
LACEPLSRQTSAPLSPFAARLLPAIAEIAAPSLLKLKKVISRVLQRASEALIDRELVPTLPLFLKRVFFSFSSLSVSLKSADNFDGEGRAGQGKATPLQPYHQLRKWPLRGSHFGLLCRERKQSTKIKQEGKIENVSR